MGTSPCDQSLQQVARPSPITTTSSRQDKNLVGPADSN